MKWKPDPNMPELSLVCVGPLTLTVHGPLGGNLWVWRLHGSGGGGLEGTETSELEARNAAIRRAMGLLEGWRYELAGGLEVKHGE